MSVILININSNYDKEVEEIINNNTDFMCFKLASGCSACTYCSCLVCTLLIILAISIYVESLIPLTYPEGCIVNITHIDNKYLCTYINNNTIDTNYYKCDNNKMCLLKNNTYCGFNYTNYCKPSTYDPKVGLLITIFIYPLVIICCISSLIIFIGMYCYIEYKYRD